MYTGLRGKVVLKEDYVAKFKDSLDSDNYFDWESILPSDNEYCSFSRNSFIPFGAVCYMPEDWDSQVEFEGNTLKFCCSLKNYSSTIDVFIKKCLPEIADSWELEELYEENETSTIYKKENK